MSLFSQEPERLSQFSGICTESGRKWIYHVHTQGKASKPNITIRILTRESFLTVLLIKKKSLHTLQTGQLLLPFQNIYPIRPKPNQIILSAFLKVGPWVYIILLLYTFVRNVNIGQFLAAGALGEEYTPRESTRREYAPPGESDSKGGAYSWYSWGLDLWEYASPGESIFGGAYSWESDSPGVCSFRESINTPGSPFEGTLLLKKGQFRKSHKTSSTF